MRKLVVSEFVTLDGVMEDPGGAEKSKFGGWSMQFFSPEAGKYKFEELMASDAMLLGRLTYQGFAAAWPKMKDTGEFGVKMNGMVKHVVTGTLKKFDWNNSSVLTGELVPSVRKLKDGPGKNILVAGSGQLVNALLLNDLVDEIRIMVHPIVVGGGKRLFRDLNDTKKLKLTDLKTLPNGVTVQTYTPA